MSRAMKILPALLLAVLCPCATMAQEQEEERRDPTVLVAPEQEPETPEPQAPAEDAASAAGEAGVDDRELTPREKLDAIREDLIQLRLEKALANIDLLLEDAALEPSDRLEAWILRSQAHVAFGDIDGAEEDYREILRQRPAFQPEGSLTTPKAMERFEKVRAGMVGTLRIEMRPADARIQVDGRDVVLAGDGILPLLAGDRVLRAERRGYDPFEEVVQVAPGVESPLSLMLIPNARTVVLRTIPEGVTVRVDGEVAGETARTGPEWTPGSGEPYGELVIEDIPLGEHFFDLSRPCYRDVQVTELLTVDIMEPAPLELETFIMDPSRAGMRFEGEPAGADILVDGRRLGVLPMETGDLCPGTRDVEVRVNSRLVYRELRDLVEGEMAPVRVGPRPNAVLVGADAWPPGFERFAGAVNSLDPVPMDGGESLASVRGWQSMSLPPDAHVAVAVLPPVEEGASDRWFLFSPLLQSVERLDLPPEAVERPGWWTNILGFDVADSRIAGDARVIRVRPGSPAESAGVRVGDTVLSLDGGPVTGAAEVRDRIATTLPGSKVAVELRPVEGETRTVEMAGIESPRLASSGEGPVESILLAAWAEQAAAAFPSRSAAPLANLALLMSEAGRDGLAAETWRRVRWGDRQGIGEGTSSYYLGRLLMRLGREKEATEAFLRSARSASTAFDDAGPALADAAADHLADLGVAVESD